MIQLSGHWTRRTKPRDPRLVSLSVAKYNRDECLCDSYYLDLKCNLKDLCLIFPELGIAEIYSMHNSFCGRNFTRESSSDP